MSIASLGKGPHLSALVARLLPAQKANIAPVEGREPTPIRPGLGDRSEQRWRSLAFFGGQVIAAAILFGLEAPRVSGDPVLFAVLLALNACAGRLSFSAYGDIRLSSDFAVIMAILVFFGAPGLVLAAPVAAIATRIRPSQPGHLFSYLLVTNTARLIIVGCASAAVYALLAPVNPARFDFALVAGGALATLVTFALYLAFTMGSLHLRKGQGLTSIWGTYVWLAPHYAALGIVGIALAGAYLGLGYLGIVAFCMPALMMRLAQKQYVDKTAESVEQLREKNNALQQANAEIKIVHEELRETYDATLEALVGALDARDQETKGHSIRVAQYMVTIAEALGVKRGSEEWTNMQRGALLHDVGKIGVSDNILLKPGKLTPAEWTDMRRHPEIGFNILREVSFLRGAAEIVLAHHERWDGGGYPKGLREGEIPLGSRIFTVVDTFDSMTSDRPYRRALSAKAALDEVLRCGGTQFDPLVVEAFLDIYEHWVLERERLHMPEMKAVA